MSFGLHTVMFLPKLMLFLFFFFLVKLGASDIENFTYNGFSGSNLLLSDFAAITDDGLLRLTNNTLQVKGHAFYPTPLKFKNHSTGNAFSFSTSFVFAIRPKFKDLTGSGIAFLLSHSNNLSGALPSQYLGLFNSINNVDASNPVVAVELDTNYNAEVNDIDGNHVGIDVNSLKSVNSSHASYHDTSIDGSGGSILKNLSLASGDPMHVWVDYDGSEKLLNVTLAPIDGAKPSIPLVSSHVNLQFVVSDTMYVGFSSSTGSFPSTHYILGWSFTLNGRAQQLDLSSLPSLPRMATKAKSMILTIVLALVAVFFVVAIFLVVVILIARRKIKYAELFEDWELEYGPQRFTFRDLFIATRGFKDGQLLGAGGFGKVYRGVLPKSHIKVAVKKISHESRQGMKEFIAEIISIGRLRHRNLAQLLGYCRRKGELLLVYDYMPNGSLDKFLFDQLESRLDWDQRLRIIKGVASGLFYLHEEWEQVVVHRDIKASNILLDGELNGRLGDFGLARLYDRGTDPQTTHVVGTLGYLAPELPRTGKSTTCTDVFAFGGFLLEVACGRRPIEMQAMAEEQILVDWVLECWKKGSILETADPKLNENYVPEEMELVLKLGLLCSHPEPNSRPQMRLVMQVLDGNTPLPELVEEAWNAQITPWGNYGCMDGYTMSDSSIEDMFAHSPSAPESLVC